MHSDRAQTLRPTCLTWKWAKTCAKVTHILRIAHMWKDETSGARKDGNLLELEATDAGSGSDRRRGRVCRATLAMALSVRATDARMPEWQTRYVSVYRPGFHGRANTRAMNARARLSIIFTKWSLLDCVRHDDRRWDSAVMDVSVGWNRPLKFEDTVDTWRDRVWQKRAHRLSVVR
jgi:hypothetical protein